MCTLDYSILIPQIYSDFGIGGVVAGTTPMIVNIKSNPLEHTGIRTGGWTPLGPHHMTDEVTLHQFGAVCGERFLYRDSTK